MRAFFTGAISPTELDDAELECVGGADGTVVVETCIGTPGAVPTYKED